VSGAIWTAFYHAAVAGALTAAFSGWRAASKAARASDRPDSDFPDFLALSFVY
jgi:hypothetical protein